MLRKLCPPAELSAWLCTFGYNKRHRRSPVRDCAGFAARCGMRGLLSHSFAVGCRESAPPALSQAYVYEPPGRGYAVKCVGSACDTHDTIYRNGGMLSGASA